MKAVVALAILLFSLGFILYPHSALVAAQTDFVNMTAITTNASLYIQTPITSSPTTSVSGFLTTLNGAQIVNVSVADSFTTSITGFSSESSGILISSPEEDPSSIEGVYGFSKIGLGFTSISVEDVLKSFKTPLPLATLGGFATSLNPYIYGVILTLLLSILTICVLNILRKHR